MKYDLFLSDFDGTLVENGGKISERNIRAIERYRAAGGVFAVVTGRMLSSILPRLRELGLRKGPVVAYQGAMIAEISTGARLKDERFSLSDGAELLRFLEGEGLHVHAYFDDMLYSNREDGFLREYERLCGVKGTVISERLFEKSMREGLRTAKILAVTEPERQGELIRRLREEFGDRFFVTASSPYFTEVLPKGQNKASAVEFLCGYYGIDPKRTAAIGDQWNDLPMLEAAGGGFAVANAEEELKRIATVVSSCREDGVAEAIEEAMRGESI